MNNELETALEALIDKHGLGKVSEAIAQICFEKAEHIESNWQDLRLAAHWQEAANRFPTSERLPT